jgi:ribosome-binding protein aMBF1 (putative translation factor)
MSFAQKVQEIKDQLKSTDLPPIEGENASNNEVFDSPHLNEMAAQKLAEQANNDGNEDANEPQTASNGNKADQGADALAEKKFESESFFKEIIDDYDGNIESAKEKLKEYKKTSSQYKELASKIEEYESIINNVKNPWADDSVRSINYFVANTGIKDISVAAKFAGKTSDDILKSPVDAIALKQVIANPDILKMASFEDIKQSVSLQYNVDEDVDINDAPTSLKIAVAEAAKDIASKFKNTENSDVFDSLALKYKKSKEDFENYASSATPAVAEIVQSLDKLKVSPLDDFSFEAQVSDAVKSQLADELRAYVLGKRMDLTPENLSQIKEAAQQRAMEIMAKDLLKSALENFKGEALKKTLQEVENGQPVARNATKIPVKTAKDDWANNWLKSKGKKL